MTKELTDDGAITDMNAPFSLPSRPAEAPLLPTIFLPAPRFSRLLPSRLIAPLAVILVFKFVGANFLRLWIARMEDHRIQEEKNDRPAA